MTQMLKVELMPVLNFFIYFILVLGGMTKNVFHGISPPPFAAFL